MQPMTLTALLREGYVQEINRRFLHVLGLSIEPLFDEHGEVINFSVLDARGDPAGIAYSPADVSFAAVQRISSELSAKAESRKSLRGFVWQPAANPLQPP